MNKGLFKKLSTTSLKGTMLDKMVKRNYASTEIPFLDLALSGYLNGGLSHGLTIFAAPSKHFKTSFLLVCIAAWQKKNPDGIVVFYDSESGSSDLTYFKNFGVNVNSVLHIPIKNIEELTSDMAQKLDAIEEGEPVLFAIDSIGNTPSRNEAKNALEGSEKSDMTRAKALKAMGRIITPHINSKKVPIVAVNHVYETLEQYSKTIMSGGTGLMLSANTVIFVGRQQNKNSNKDLVGYNFDLIIDKSRNIREKSKFPIIVNFDGGINRYSSIFEHALKYKFITSPSKGWYEYNGKKYRKADLLEDDTVLMEILKNPDFVTLVEGQYTLDIEVRLKSQELAASRGAVIDGDVESEEDDEESEMLEDLV